MPVSPSPNLSTMTASESPSTTVYGKGSEGVGVNVIVAVSVTVAVIVGVDVLVGVKVNVGVGVSVANNPLSGAFDPLVSQMMSTINPSATNPMDPYRINRSRCWRFLRKELSTSEVLPEEGRLSIGVPL